MEKEESSEISDDKKNLKLVDLDTILITEVGQFGRYQLKTIALLAVAVIFTAWVSTEYLFTAARISTRCLIPECEDLITELEFSPSWILNAVPSTNGEFDNCQRFANTSASSDITNGTCSAELFAQHTIVCDQYVYENNNTVVFDFGLACDEWRRSLIGFVRTFGSMAGLPLTGFISDRWGRRTALIFTIVNAAWLGLTRCFASTYIGFLISELVESIFVSGTFSCSYISAMELVGPKFRVASGAMMNSFYAFGQIFLGLIAWAVPNWRRLTLTIYTPQFLTIAYFWLLTESVRWYMSKGRYEESEKILKRAARTNGRELSEQSLMALKQAEEEKKKKEKEEKMIEPWLVVLVFRHKPILLRCMVSPVWWITMTFVYYGLTINAVNILSGNTYINYIAVTAVEIPGFWVGFALMGKLGRKPVLTAAFWICAACQLAFLLMPKGLYIASLTVYLIGKFSIAVVVTTVYVYTAELYPTKYRHRLFAFSSMIGRIGSITAPLTPAFGESLPFILFASFSLLSGVLVLLAPETLGAKFPDTMEEAASQGKKKTLSN